MPALDENVIPTAIVTGAGSGIGRQTVLQLAGKGYRVALVGRTAAKLDETAALADQASDGKTQSLVIPADLCEHATANAIVDQTLDAFGRIDAIAHVAGDAPMLAIDRVTPEIWRRCIDTNLSAAVALTVAAWPVMRSQNSGIIVNVSSMASVDPFPHFAIYAAAKAGLNMFTRCIADEGRESGIRAVTIAPGAVETPMLRSLFDERSIPPENTLDPAAVAAKIVDCVTGRLHHAPGETILMPSP